MKSSLQGLEWWRWLALTRNPGSSSYLCVPVLEEGALEEDLLERSCLSRSSDLLSTPNKFGRWEQRAKKKPQHILELSSTHIHRNLGWADWHCCRRSDQLSEAADQI